MNKKVIAAGHICLDITPVFHGTNVNRLDDILSPGKLVHVGAPDIHVGGSVSNTGLAMKILGADVSLAGKVGDDAFGILVKQALQEQYHAADGLIIGRGESTSYSVVVAIPGIDRIFLHNPGANDTFTADDISGESLKETALFHFGYPPLMRNMYLNEGSELIKVFEKAKAQGAATSLDMASVDPDSPAGSADWEKILQRVLPYVDFFEPSVEELCYMLDPERFADWKKRADGRDVTEILDIDRDVRPLADKCMEMGARVLLIKCGTPGIYYRTAGENRLREISKRVCLDCAGWSDREGFEKSYIPDKVLSGTGAGDTCIAAFLTAMLDGCTLEECMHLAAATGASCVAAYDAVSGLKSFEDLRKKINDGWKKIQ